MPDPTGTPTNGTVTQGPKWLWELYQSPPPWLNPSLKVLALVSLAVVAYRVYQWDGDISLDVQREMQIVTAHITAIATTTLAMVNIFTYGYLIDISVGFIVGYGSVLLLQVDAVSSRLPGPTRPRERTMAVWAVIGLSAVGLPMLVSTRGIGVQLTKSRYFILGIATVMFAYNAVILSDHISVETQSDA